MRITTNMIRNNFQSGLYDSLGALELTRYQTSTGRRFEHSYQDPISSSQSVLLENRYARNEDYIRATEDTQKWLDSQEDAISQINNIAKEVDKNYSVAAVSDTSVAGRGAYAATFRELQDSMIYSLNVKYGETYVLAGEDGLEAPFAINDAGEVTFRGINVSTTDPDELLQLEEMAKETSFVDLGFGLTIDETTGEVMPATAFDAALSGLNVVGFGTDADGNPENMIALLGDMAELLEADTFDREQYETLWTKFSGGAENVRDELTAIGAKSNLLTETHTRLENEKINITEQFDSAVNIDPAEAITDFSYAMYVYEAALKIGNNILSPSLLDYLQ